MMHDTLGTPIGPKDPRDRLEFVKKVVWGLIHKYTPPSNRTSFKWKYFVTNFPYFLRITNTNGRRFRLNHVAQVPKDVEKVKRTVMKLKVATGINSSWSLTQIMNWAGSKI
jgi:hypothetical protein